MVRNACGLALILALAGAAPAARAAAGPAREPAFAIQERIFDRYHEVGLLGGFIPDEEFHYAFPVGVDYIYNFTENVAWEVVKAQYVLNREKALKKDLEDDFGVTPSKFDTMKFMIHSNLILKPSYGKDALRNRSVINHETYLLLGGGLVSYEEETSEGEKHAKNALSLSLGIGRKYFLTKTWCLNLEVRDLVNFKHDGIKNNVVLGIGLGYRFNLAPRTAEKDDGVERLKTLLNEGAPHD